MDTSFATISEIRSSVSVNLAKVRQSRGMTLSGLAEISGIGKATLSGIEAGKGNPTIETVWRLARALDVPFGELIESDDEQTVVSMSKGVSVRLIHRQSSPHVIETYIMELAPRTKRHADKHMPGVEENIVVLKGQVLVGSMAEPAFVSTGKSHSFKGDVPHLYQSLDEFSSLLVSVIYPVISEITLGNNDVQRYWPLSEDDWIGLRHQTERMALESRQGIAAVRLSFKQLPADRNAAVSQLKEKMTFLAYPGKPCTQCFVVDEQEPMLINLSRQGRKTLFTEFSEKNTLLNQAMELCNRSSSLWTPLQQEEITALNSLAQTNTVCLATLAAETLTRHGYPLVPLRAAPEYMLTELPKKKKDDAVLFEDRINVDAYAAYELVHPAYAQQSVFIAQHLEKFFQGQPGNILDIGTGPGLPLKMLLELMPQLEVTTVDPSQTAFQHQQKLFKGYTNVHSLKASITELDGPKKPYPAAISVGASHHLDTLDFFSSVRNQLSSGAIFIVADEMISPFSDSLERKTELIKHHLQYIADTLVPIDTNGLSPEENLLVREIQNNIPLALFEAKTDDLTRAEYRCRHLFESLRLLALPIKSHHPLLSFYRLHLLELEALVAGFDYEVEQKTNPQCFADLACSAGFSVSHHQRIYATSGREDWDAGTHLFVLSKL
ncbi:helix-turn-helix domain-containing protein [Sodalis sp. RH14]|uniref:helix-turn-helix domain-containing protein n=1 Tax=Sodalis sp. RH14 TaxID=3394329 RepID=UPI0039B63F42